MPRLYLSPPDVGPRERELLLAAFDSNWVAPAGPDLVCSRLHWQNVAAASMRLRSPAVPRPSTWVCCVAECSLAIM